MGDEFDIYDLIGDGNMFEIPEQDVWDLIGDPGALGLGGGEEGVDPWGLMGDTGAFGLGGDSGLSLGSIGGWLSQIGRLFGGGSGSESGANGGGMGMSPLMTLLGLGALAGGGINQYGSTREATDAMLAANRDAQALVREQMGKNEPRFAPWTGAGAGAVGQLSAMPASNLAASYGGLADRYRPLGSGRGMVPQQPRSLGGIARGGR